MYRKWICDSIKDLILEKVSQSDKNLETIFVIWYKLSWKTFIKVYECKLTEFFDVIISCVHFLQLVAIRMIWEKNVNKMLHLFKRIQHFNIFSFQKYFSHEKLLFIFYDDILILLNHIIVCKVYLNEIELIIILIQISSSQ